MKIRLEYNVPTRQKLASVLVPAEYDKMRKKVEDVVNKQDFEALSTDGWTDNQQNNIINFIVHTPKPYLWESINATNETKTSIYIAETIKIEIEKIGKQKVVSVLTDHAPNMVGAWKILNDEYPHIIFQGCKAHAID